jgi:transposase
MANHKSVAMIDTLITLHKQGWSNRKISRELEIDRETVSKYVRRYKAANEQNPPVSLTGSESENPPISIAGSAGRPGKCNAHESTIEDFIKDGLSAQRIYQELCSNHEFAGSYSSVQRFVRKLREALPEPFRRMECSPGEEAQVDFGRGAPIVADGRRRIPHLLRVTLSHSRKSYSEVMYKQDSESFLRGLENAFRCFGGVPKTIVPDNMKTAVIKADWYDPEINPKLSSFAVHYNTVILPCKVRMPRHKGKVESAVKYVQNNALKGRKFDSLAAQNRFLAQWERNVADTRIHGTTREQVQLAFEREKGHLQALAESLFPCFQEARRKVHTDGHITVAKAYYSVPPEYLRRNVWVRWDGRIVRIFDPAGFKQVRVHSQVEPGKFSTTPADVPKRKISNLERGQHYLMKKIAPVGDEALAWAQAMLKARGIEGDRVLCGLVSLCSKYPAADINVACRNARETGQWRLRPIRIQLKEQPQQQPALLQCHPIIRPPQAYGSFLGELFANTDHMP